jgi:hypothetical protein
MTPPVDTNEAKISPAETIVQLVAAKSFVAFQEQSQSS